MTEPMNSPHMTSPQAWLRAVLTHLGIDAEVEENPPALAEKFKAFGGTWLNIESDGLSSEVIERLLGERGTNLDALQYLLNVTMNLHKSDDESQTHAYTLELNGHREAHYSELVDLAMDAAQKVRVTQEEVEMPTSLTAAERRLIHTVLVEELDLETLSRGQERDRRLVVRPAQE